MSEPALFLDGRVALHAGDCLDILKTLPSNSIDSCVTDPPYHLTSIVKRFSGETAPARSQLEQPADKKLDGIMAGSFKRLARGFMGQTWDGGDIAFRVELWAEVFRVLKPGAHVLAFSATRTYHRMACAIEDAGFEIRDMVPWLYGTGFPKSHDVAKGIDKAAGATREVVGRRPDHVLSKKWRESEGRTDMALSSLDITAPSSEAARQWDGWGTALKPALEPICLARKPLSEGTVAANVLRWGTGALNIDACRIGGGELRVISGDRGRAGSQSIGEFRGSEGYTTSKGRWPANLVHDGSDEVVGAFPSADAGSAARFFYSAKADGDDRIGSKHPTVKPVDLMAWLCRLVTPAQTPGGQRGIVLDPFAGTGTTGEAAWREGFCAVLVEREAAYRADIARRMDLAQAGPETRRLARLALADPKPVAADAPQTALVL